MHTLNYDVATLEKMMGEQMLTIDMIGPDDPGYQALSAGDKQALGYLRQAAHIFNDVAQEQDHPQNRALRAELVQRAPYDRQAQLSLQLFDSLGGVTGLNGLDPDPVCVFTGVHGYKGRNFYPPELTVERFHEILIQLLQQGKKEQVQDILSARTMVRFQGDTLVGIDYTIYFEQEFSKVAQLLEQAALCTTDQAFARYLKAQSAALTHTDNRLDAQADNLWSTLTGDLEWTLSRENYDDEMTPTIWENPTLVELIRQNDIVPVGKDTLGVRVGVVNRAGTQLIRRFKDLMALLAKKMPLSDQYSQSISADGDVKQEAVDVDLVALTGDYAQCRGQITTAQNLPNDDKLAFKMGYGRRNVYHRQVRQTYGAVEAKAVLNYLVQAPFHRFFDPNAHHLFVIGHENGHSLGPDSSFKGALGLYGATIEENKADLVSIAFMPEYAKAGIITEEELKKVYASWIFRLFPRTKPQLIQPHRIADLIHLNALVQGGGITTDDTGKIALHFDKIHAVVWHLLTQTIEVQLSRSAENAKAFIEQYTAWGKLPQHMVQVWKSLNPKIYKKIQEHF